MSLSTIVLNVAGSIGSFFRCHGTHDWHDKTVFAIRDDGPEVKEVLGYTFKGETITYKICWRCHLTDPYGYEP